MTSPQAETYAREQQAAVMAAVAAAGMAAGMAGFQLVNFTVFMRFLRMLFPTVLRGRERAAWSARNFFDLERRRVTGLPRMDVPLIPEYQFDWFVRDMKPAFDMTVKQIRAVRELERQGIPSPPPKVEATLRVAVAKTVADAGRKQMREAIQADAERAATLRETKKQAAKAKKALDRAIDLDYPDVVGWARKATGNETCAWCLMLVSRGPVYMFADTAGSGDVAESDVVDSFLRGDAAEMKQWHLGCDCTVVPVFNKADWPGKEDAADALEQWKDARGEYDEDKLYRVRQKDGTYRMEKLPKYEALQRETLNNLRFALQGRDRKATLDELDELKKLQRELARR